MRNNTEGMNGEGSGLQRVANKIENGGLPSVEEMRAVVEENRGQELSATVTKKLSEYEVLFNKFKSGTATDKEVTSMTNLSTELENIRKNLGLNNE